MFQAEFDEPVTTISASIVWTNTIMRASIPLVESVAIKVMSCFDTSLRQWVLHLVCLRLSGLHCVLPRYRRDPDRLQLAYRPRATVW